MRPASFMAAIISVASCIVLSNSASAQAAMTLEVDQSKPIRFTTAITGVVVGNAGIADVIVHDSKTLFVIGKSVGSTHVLAVDQRGRTVFSGPVVVRASDMAGLVTIQRGRELSTSLCDTRCIAYAHSESGTAGMSDAIARASSRTAFASGGGGGPK